MEKGGGGVMLSGRYVRVLCALTATQEIQTEDQVVCGSNDPVHTIQSRQNHLQFDPKDLQNTTHLLFLIQTTTKTIK